MLKTRPMGIKSDSRRMVMQWTDCYSAGERICQIPENEQVGPVQNLRTCTMEVTKKEHYTNKPVVDPYTEELVTVQKLTVQAQVPAWGDLAAKKQPLTWVTVCQGHVQFLYHSEHKNDARRELLRCRRGLSAGFSNVGLRDIFLLFRLWIKGIVVACFRGVRCCL